MGLMVVVYMAAKHGPRVVHIGESGDTGLRIMPQWLAAKLQSEPASYRFYNTDHLQTKDEGIVALGWLIEDLYAQVKSLRLDVSGLLSREGVGQETRGGG